MVCGQRRRGAALALLAVLGVAGCGPKVYLRSVGAEGADKAKIAVQNEMGVPLLLLDDGQDSEPDSILVFDNDELLCCYHWSREDGTELLVWRAGRKSEDCGAKTLALRFPELAEKGADRYVALDKVLGQKRAMRVQGTNMVLRRTTTVGTVKPRQRLEWTRPAGVVRVGAIVEFDTVNPFALSDWLTVEAGKSYEVRFSRSEAAFEGWSLEEDAKASARAREAAAARSKDFMAAATLAAAPVPESKPPATGVVRGPAMRRSLPSLNEVAVVTDAFVFTIVWEGPAPVPTPGAATLLAREPAGRPEVTVVSLEDSITIGNLLAASAARYAAQKRFRVPPKQPATVGLALDQGTHFRVIQKKGSESQEVPAPLHVDGMLAQDEPYREALKVVQNRLDTTSSLTERVTPSDFVLGGPEMESHLGAIRERTGCDGLLVVTGRGLALPTGYKVARIISAVAADVVFSFISSVAAFEALSRTSTVTAYESTLRAHVASSQVGSQLASTVTSGSRSEGLATRGTLVDLRSGEVLWSNFSALSANPRDEDLYEEEWPRSLLYHLPAR